ncbi:hypothetical protein FKM82_021000, partial [Ascaphus truei]
VCPAILSSTLNLKGTSREAALSPRGNFSNSEEDKIPSSNENQALPNIPRVSYHNPHTKIEIIRKEQAKNTQRYKVDYDQQSTDTLNFSSEYKQETEYVSMKI